MPPAKLAKVTPARSDFGPSVVAPQSFRMLGVMDDLGTTPATPVIPVIPGRRPLRVLVVERGGSGGLAQYSHGLCGALGDYGVDVTLLTPVRQALPPVAGSYEVREILANNIGQRRPKALALEARNASASLAAVARIRPDFVLVEAATPGRMDELWLRAARLWGAKIVWVAHDLGQREWGGVLKPFALRLYRFVDAMVTLTEAERKKLALQLPSVATATTVIPHGDFRFLVRRRPDRDEARRHLGVAPGDGVLLFFGYLKAYKGIDDFVDALIILRHRGRKVTAMIAGDPGDSGDHGGGAAKALADRIDAAGLTEHVLVRAGFVPNDEVPDFFAAADVVVLPYRDATQSGVTQMAYAYGRPVVVTDVGGLAEDVEVGTTGEVASARDPESLADAIERVIAEPDRLVALHRQLESTVPARFAWPAVATAHLALFERLGAGRRPKGVGQ